MCWFFLATIRRKVEMARPDQFSTAEQMIIAVIFQSSSSLHGRAISEEIEVRSEGHFSLPPGTLYPALKRLAGKKGCIVGTWESLEDAAAEGRPRRQYWKLTDRGRAAYSEIVKLYEIMSRILKADADSSPED